jgi:hypothetical protein
VAEHGESNNENAMLLYKCINFPYISEHEICHSFQMFIFTKIQWDRFDSFTQLSSSVHVGFKKKNWIIIFVLTLFNKNRNQQKTVLYLGKCTNKWCTISSKAIRFIHRHRLGGGNPPVLMDVLAFFMDCAKTSRLSTGADCNDAATVTELC